MLAEKDEQTIITRKELSNLDASTTLKKYVDSVSNNPCQTQRCRALIANTINFATKSPIIPASILSIAVGLSEAQTS